MKKRKRLLAALIVMSLMLGLFPTENVYASEPEAVQEIITEESTEAVTEEATEAVMESQEEPVDEETGNETETADENQSEQEDEIIIQDEQPAEPETITEDENPLSVQEDDETIVMETEEDVDIKMYVNAAAEDYPPTGTVLAAGDWGNGYYWYVYRGPKAEQWRHYIFCLDHGSTMHSGVYSFKEQSGKIGTQKDTFRIAVAMDYFKSKGGWSSQNGYVDAQYAVWNQGSTDQAKKLIKYADNLWNLTEINPDRASMTSVTGIKNSEKDNAHNLKNIKTYKCKLDKSGKVTKTVTPSNGSWKYFASGAEGMGGISVYKMLDADGKTVKSGASASVGSDGKIKISFTPDKNNNYGKPGKPLTVVFKVNQTYSGNSSIKYLDCGSGKQRMSYDASFSSPAYYAVKVYASDTDSLGAEVNIIKVDDFDNEVPGAVFNLYRTEGDYDKSVVTGNDEKFDEIEKPGTYILREISTLPGMKKLKYAVFITATKVTEGGTSKIKLTSGVVGPEMSVQPSDDGLSLTYTCVNHFAYGDAYMNKVGNVFVKYENGQFIYENRTLEQVNFELYTGEDIYLGDTLLWQADTLLTQEMLDADIWSQILKHSPKVTTLTDKDGNITFKDLPVGNYYLLETHNPYEGYGVYGTRINFVITDGGNTAIAGGTYPNEAVPAHVTVIKKADEDKKNPDGEESDLRSLPNAEFTLYANVMNTNYDNQPLFTVDNTQPAVISRDKYGHDIVENNTWIPLETIYSDDSGIGSFSLALPYGKYMVAETNPPDGYALSEGDSYIFEHKYNPDENYSGGKVFTHTFFDKEISNLILVQKFGEFLTSTKTVSTKNGEYEELIYKKEAAKDVSFVIKDNNGKIVETITTGENGMALSSNLVPGTYTVEEKENGGRWKPSMAAQEVTLEDNNTAVPQIKELLFENESYLADTGIYKTAEIAELSDVLPEEVSQSNLVYSYKTVPVPGVVFSLHNSDDIKDLSGKVILKSGSCLGYCSTDKDGFADIKAKLPEGNYFFKEIKTCDRQHILDDSFYGITVNYDAGDFKGTARDAGNPVINKLLKGSIKVIKTNEEKTVFLKGVKFSLYNSNKKVIGKFLTDENGEIFIDYLPVGTYYLQETETQKGYELDDSFLQVDLTETDLEQVVEITNKKKADTWISIKTNTSIKGGGHVKTGDLATVVMFFFMMMNAAVFILLITLKRHFCHTPEKKRKKRISEAGLLAAVLLCVMGFGVRAEAADGTLRSDGLIECDGLLYAFADSSGKILPLIYEQNSSGNSVTSTSERKLSFSPSSDASYNNNLCWVVLVGAIENSDSSGIKELPESISFKVKSVSDKYYIGETDNEGLYFTIGENYSSSSAFHRGNNYYDITETKDTSSYNNVADFTFKVCGINYVVDRRYEFINMYRDNSYESGRHVTYFRLPEHVNIPEDVKYGSSGIIGYTTCNVHSEDLTRIITESDIKVTVSNNKIDAFRYVNEGKTSGDWDATKPNEAFAAKCTLYYDSPLDKALKAKSINSQSYFMGTINYHLNGGELPAGTPVNYVINRGLDRLPEPLRKDYKFSGWCSEEDLRSNSAVISVSDIDFSKTSIDLYAKWEYSVDLSQKGVNYHISTYKTATVMPGNYTGNIILENTIRYNGFIFPVTSIADGAFSNSSISSITVPENITSIPTNAFSGCNNLRDVKMESMSARLGNSFPSTVNLTAYASSMAYRYYKQDGYTGTCSPIGSRIFYEMNGGKNSPDNPDIYPWKSTLVLQKPERDGYIFGGWYTDGLYSDMSKVETIYSDTYHDILLYAKWIDASPSDINTNQEQIIPEKEEEETVENSTEAETITVPQKITGLKIKRRGKKGFIIFFNSTKSVTGYHIQYSTSKNFAKRKTKTITTKNSGYVLTNLNKNKHYYIRVRAFKKADGKTVYGKWSVKKKVKGRG